MKQLFVFFVGLVLLGCKNTTKQADYYKEQHRPQFHFSPAKGWMNDPNGLVYYEGEYHLFYQHYPDSTVWGPMHWGHAVSTDLVHWQHLPIALYPDSLGYIFSGSAVVDSTNTSGFGKNGIMPLVSIFTIHNMEWEKAGRKDRESQGIAYSLDKGRTWTKYAGNPVLKNKGDVDFRDPKVFWYAPTKRWIMPLAVGEHLEIFASPDLKNWEKTGEFGQNEGAHGGVWECPDLFPLKTKEGVEKWILIQNMGRGAVNGGSGTQYFVGTFDGKTFKNDNPSNQVLWLDYGADNYAGVTWFGAPNNRRLFIGWMSNWDDYANTVPTSTWRSALTVPRELSLVGTPEGLRLHQVPVKEVEQLWGSSKGIQKQAISQEVEVDNQGVEKDVTLTFDIESSTAQQVGFELRNSKNEKLRFGYDVPTKQLFIDRTQSGKINFSAKFPKKHTAPYLVGKTLTIRALIDNSAIEVFIDGGRAAFTEVFFPNEDFSKLILFSEGGQTQLVVGEIHSVNTIWKQP
ncbi:MAG: glycoside hydrolase family 32 protein [Spirosomataceae bacterium]